MPLHPKHIPLPNIQLREIPRSILPAADRFYEFIPHFVCNGFELEDVPRGGFCEGFPDCAKEARVDEEVFDEIGLIVGGEGIGGGGAGGGTRWGYVEAEWCEGEDVD